METLCSWCDAPAQYTDGRVAVEEEDRQYACEQHKRDLLTSMELSLWHRGNPFAGEAAEGWIRNIAHA